MYFLTNDISAYSCYSMVGTLIVSQDFLRIINTIKKKQDKIVIALFQTYVYIKNGITTQNDDFQVDLRYAF